jgi:hypothetical protein
MADLAPGELEGRGALPVCEAPAVASTADFGLITSKYTGTITATTTTTKMAITNNTNPIFRRPCSGRTGAPAPDAASVFDKRKPDADGEDSP